MALVERNISLSKSKSKTALDNKTSKKMSKSLTVAQIKQKFEMAQTDENNVPFQPIIKEPVLLNPRRTLSKCKAKTDLKSTATPVLEIPNSLSKSKTIVKLNSINQNQTLVPITKVLSKSRTSVKLVPSCDIPTAASTTTTISTSNKSLSKSKTAAKLAQPIEEKSMTKSNTLTKLKSKSKASLKLQTVGDIDIGSNESKAESKLQTSTSTNKLSKRRSVGKSRTSMRLQAVEICISNNNPENCDKSSSNTISSENVNRSEIKQDIFSSKGDATLDSEKVPEKSLKKYKTFNKLKNDSLETNPFRKTRSQSLFKTVPDSSIEALPKTENDKPGVIEEMEEANLETPKTATVDPERQRRLMFTDVDVFYFDRTPGHSSIPRDGFNTIGMDMRHCHHENLRFNLAKDILRRNLFGANSGRVADIQTDPKESPSDEDVILDATASSPSTKRRHSQTKMHEDAVRKTSTVLVSPSKLQKSQPQPSAPAPDCGSPVVRRLALDDGGEQLQSYRSSPRLSSAKSTSTMLSDVMRRNAVDNSARKLSTMFSSAHIETKERSDTVGGIKKCQSTVNISQVPTLATPGPQLMLTPAQRGSGSVSPPASKAKGECGTRGMTPLSSKARVSLLRSHGILNIDREEAEEIKTIRESRETCGCSCKGHCLPESCECVMNDIECQIERSGFPCSCGPGCGNPHGRKVFDEMEVSMHYINTMMTLKAVLK